MKWLAMTKSKNVTKFPPDFSIEKYDFLKNKDYPYLLELLHIRRLLMPKIRYGTTIYQNAAGQEVEKEEAIVDMEKIINFPEYFVTDFPPAELIYEPHNKDINDHLITGVNESVYTHLVHEFSLWEFVDIAVNNAWSIIDQPPEGSIHDARQNNLSFNQAFKHRLFEKELTIQVDLNARDSEIVEDFKLFLIEARRIHNIEEPIKTATIDSISRKIINYRIIPYLDLDIWSKLNGTTVRASIILNAIYPDMVDNITEYELRTRIKKYAEIAISRAFLNSLESSLRRKK